MIRLYNLIFPPQDTLLFKKINIVWNFEAVSDFKIKKVNWVNLKKLNLQGQEGRR